METTQKFQIIPEAQGLKIKAYGSTRAGLMIAALKAVFSENDVSLYEEAENKQRDFNFNSQDFESLIVELLTLAVTLSKTHQEVYEDIKFSLITDKLAKGYLVGRKIPVSATSIKSIARQGLTVGKNEAGLWEAEIKVE